MPRIVVSHPYDGAGQRISRLGLQSLLDELYGILSGFELRVLEQKDANGGAAIRKLIDREFGKAGGWAKTTVGDVDWVKCKYINGTAVCIGVEVQFSARSDLIIRDLVHLRDAINLGEIDLGILVLPADLLSYYATDRGPSISAGMRVVREMKVDELPLLLIAIEHDGPGPALAKQEKKQKKNPTES